MKKVLRYSLIALIFSFAFSTVALAAPAQYDVNGDGRIGLVDVLRILKATVSDTYTEAADADSNGEVTVADVLLVLRSVLNGEELNAYSYVDIVERMTDTRWLAKKGNGEKTAEITSYSHDSAYENGEYINWDANNDGIYYISETEDGGWLLADIEGAGYISRIWSATAGAGLVNMYIDGATEPTISLSFEDYFNCTEAPFLYENLVYDDAALGKNNYVPITFAKSCKIVAYGGLVLNNDYEAYPEGWGKFYHFSYTLFPEGTKVEPMPKSFSAEQIAALEVADTFFGEKIGTHPEGDADAAFETFTVTKDAPAVKTLDGKGAISGLLLRVDSLADAYAVSYTAVEALKNLRIKIFWDGETAPSVDAPLGDFFASGFGYDTVKTLTLGVRDDRTFYNYFYMPYLTGARIEISNIGDTALTVSLAINVTDNSIADKNMLHFSTQVNLGGYIDDAARYRDYHFLTAKGAGRFVGLTLHLHKKLHGVDPDSGSGPYWWGEGDERFFIDGEKFPSWFGTGTEDFFGYAWCNASLYTKAYHAQSYCVGGVGGIGNRVETRLLIGDSIPFNESFEGYLEKYYSDEYVRYGFTSYFYLEKDGTVEDVNYDSSAPLDYYAPSDDYRITEGEDMYVESFTGEDMKTTMQAITTYAPSWSKQSQLLVSRLTPGDSVDFMLPAPADGEYMLLASLANTKNYGIVQLAVNGVTVGSPIDTYAPSLVATTLSEVGKVNVTAGCTNTITFTVTDKNTASSGYYFGIDFLLLVPAEEYTTLAEFDLSEYTDVKRVGTKASVVTDPLVWEGEDEMLTNAEVSAATFRAQSMSYYGTSWSGDQQLFWYNTGTAGATLTTYIWVPEAGIYALCGGYTTAKDYAIFSIAINGETVGENVDCYNTSVAHRVVEHGMVMLNAGYNKVVYTTADKNSAATRYVFGVDYLKAEKAEVFEGEAEMLENAVVTAGSAPRVQEMAKYGISWSGNQQLYWNNPSGLDATLTTSITVSEAGEYILGGGYTTATDYGVFELYVNGNKVGDAVDCASTSVAHLTAVHGTVTLNAGENELVFKMVGATGSLIRYRFGVDYICLQKVE